MTMMIEALARVQARIGFWPQITQPQPDFGGPGIGALNSISGVVYAGVITLTVISVLLAAAMIAVGHHSGNNRMQKIGVVGLFCAIAGVAVAGSAAGLLTWGQTLKIV